MKRIQMPSSYAVVPDGEKALLGGGGAFRDAWTSFTDHLRFVEGVHTFFFGGPSKAAEDLQTYKNDMSALRADAKSQRG